MGNSVFYFHVVASIVDFNNAYKCTVCQGHEERKEDQKSAERSRWMGESAIQKQTRIRQRVRNARNNVRFGTHRSGKLRVAIKEEK